jgi:ketosteroid isomerase-like protein
MTNEQIVKKLWDIINAREFARVKPLLHDDFVCIWPQSKERIRGADNFVALNENYPGKWAVHVKRVVSAGDLVVSEVELTDGKDVIFAVSFFEVLDGKIVKATEYWGDAYAAPAWRKQWVEKL